LTVYTLDSLALEIQLNHRDLANRFLGLPVDTGQIVSIETFIKEYNNSANSISTPINNKLVSREAELAAINEKFEKHDLIILTGPAGVGKTHLAIECLKKFLKSNDSYLGYCISNKNYVLLNDLYLTLDKERDYILFIDDANRLDTMNQVVGFIKSERIGKLKLLLTVRDYAFHTIGNLFMDYNPYRIDIAKLEDSVIEQIIAGEPYGIKNLTYQDKIKQIANGNPRLAIMASRLALDERRIGALNDVSDLFENYFSVYIKDSVLINTLFIKCLGLISFFHTLPYKNEEKLSPILEDFNISYYDFIESIDTLEKFELVELQYSFVKIPEQNLSSYFFFKAFIDDRLLSLETLIDNYYSLNRHRFADNFVSVSSTFGSEKVQAVLRPVIVSRWNKIKNKKKLALDFLDTFSYILRNEAKEFILNLISEKPKLANPEFALNHDLIGNERNELILNLLGRFYFSISELQESLELSFEYVKVAPESYQKLMQLIVSSFSFFK